MQVSNSSSQSTAYRVGRSGAGNAPKFEIELHIGSTYSNSPARGKLQPGESEVVVLGGGEVEFWIDDSLVASARFSDDPGTVTLVQTPDGRYHIEVGARGSAAA
jgi:hypothetical protein